MNLHQIAHQWAEAKKLRDQARELSDKSLATKFECSQYTLHRALQCRPCSLPEEDQILIRECAAERKRLRMKAEGVTIVGLCRRHKIGRENLITALMEIGEWGEA